MRVFHRYTFRGQFHFWFYSLISYVFIILAALSIFNSATIDQMASSIVALFLAFLGLWSAHFYSEITTDEEGLLIQFCFWRLRVQWTDIIEVKPIEWNYLIYAAVKNFSDFPSFLVRTNALTPFHKLYDFQGFSFKPSFVYQYDISGKHELHSSLQQRKLIQKSEKLAV